MITAGRVVPDERTVTSTLTALSGMTVLGAFLIAAATLFGSLEEFDEGRFRWSSWWFVRVGEAFVAVDASWLLPTFLAVVLAFYAALVGQSVTGTTADAARHTRRRLVPAGLAVATVVVLFDASALSAMVFGSADGAHLPGLIAVSIAVIFLGIGVGRFEMFSLSEKVRSAHYERVRAENRLAALSMPDRDRSLVEATREEVRGPHLIAVVVVHTVALVVLDSVLQALALSTVGYFNGDISRLFVIFFVLDLPIVTIGLLIPAVLVRQAYGGAVLGRRLCHVSAIVVSLFFFLPVVVWSVSGESISEVLMLAIPSLICFSAVQLTLFPFETHLLRRLHRISLRSAIHESARTGQILALRSIEKRIVDLEAALHAAETPELSC